MGQALNCGQMALVMKVNGVTTKLMDSASFGMLMVMFMKGIGEMIKPMVMEFTSTRTVQGMKANG